MQLVDNQNFLKHLTALFESTKEHGSIWLTHKRLTRDGVDASTKEGVNDAGEYIILLRMTDGKDTNFSTKIEPGNLDKFHAAYGSLLKASMTTLRKRDKKREKQRAEELARRKRRMAQPIVIEGPKRGNGRKTRQRRIKAAVKQRESQEKAKERELAKGTSTS